MVSSDGTRGVKTCAPRNCHGKSDCQPKWLENNGVQPAPRPARRTRPVRLMALAQKKRDKDHTLLKCLICLPKLLVSEFLGHVLIEHLFAGGICMSLNQRQLKLIKVICSIWIIVFILFVLSMLIFNKEIFTLIKSIKIDSDPYSWPLWRIILAVLAVFGWLVLKKFWSK